jgi:hypothetical protein
LSFVSDAGRVVLFTGPTGAGKTTCGRTWAERRATTTAWFDHDDARFLVRAGYVSRRAAAADEALRPEADRQWLLAASVCEAMGEAFVADGVDFALSAFRPPGEWKGCWRRLDALDPVVIVLLPPMEVALAHDETRTGRARTGEASVRRAYAYPWDDWRSHRNAHVLDNAQQSVDEVVEHVDAIVDRTG